MPINLEINTIAHKNSSERRESEHEILTVYLE